MAPVHCNFTEDLLVAALPPLLLTEFVLGVLGNGLALWIFCFHLKPWNSSTVFLFNLALADFLVNVALPFRASYYVSKMAWRFGQAFCNVSLFLLATNRTGSILFLMAVAVDRYMRVVHPHHPVNSLRVSKAMCGAFALWLVPVSMAVPLLFGDQSDGDRCESFAIHRRVLDWHRFAFLFSFYLPLAVIIYCTVRIIGHLRERHMARQARIKRALNFMAVVVVVFVVCFLPSNVTVIVIALQVHRNAGRPDAEFCDAMDGLNAAFYVTVSLTYLNSTLNPLVYYLSSPTVQNVCRKAVGLGQAEASEDVLEKKTRETGSQDISQLGHPGTVHQLTPRDHPPTVTPRDHPPTDTQGPSTN